jgi:hypothetical protein
LGGCFSYYNSWTKNLWIDKINIYK